jgi:hypothetical protein
MSRLQSVAADDANGADANAALRFGYAIGDTLAEFANSTPELKHPNKRRRKHIGPSRQCEIYSQRSACQVIDMEIEHG